MWLCCNKTWTWKQVADQIWPRGCGFPIPESVMPRQTRGAQPRSNTFPSVFHMKLWYIQLHLHAIKLWLKESVEISRRPLGILKPFSDQNGYISSLTGHCCWSPYWVSCLYWLLSLHSLEKLHVFDLQMASIPGPFVSLYLQWIDRVHCNPWIEMLKQRLRVSFTRGCQSILLLPSLVAWTCFQVAKLGGLQCDKLHQK